MDRILICSYFISKILRKKTKQISVSYNEKVKAQKSEGVKEETCKHSG